MKRIFVCSALRGDIEINIQNAQKYCRWVANECGAVPIAPHLIFPQFLDDSNEKERQLGIEMGLDLLCGCSELWYFGEIVTQGMVTEINEALKMEIPIQHISNEEIKVDEYGGVILS